MLVLQRSIGQRIVIDGRIIIELCAIRSDRTARIGVTAPPDVRIDREEIAEKIHREGSCQDSPNRG